MSSDFFFNLSLGTIQLLKSAVVYLGLLFFLLLSLVDIPMISSGEIRQGFLLIGMYFWTIYRPHILPYPVVFMMGLLLDILSGGLIGLNALCFMVLTMIVRSQRRFLLGQSWQMVWAGFFVAVIVVQSFQTAVYAATSAVMPVFWPYAANIVLTGLFYPLFHPVLMALNRFLND
ncbi:MAG TPA: rod shape-determining protein MreD [Alphaproteobacteria bacterium]|nr:rod shape-determining protein MreD [Alphaproteobacteria bacterium]HNS44025.1 rod shape-determining protein MreD [Alphaproteobacteria bacterium]